MPRHDGEQARHSRETLIERYVLAFDQGDMAAMAEVIEAAQTDVELDRLLIEVNSALYAETGLPQVDEPAETVQAMLREYLPSAFDPEPPEPAPVTVDDVARQLAADAAKGLAIPTSDAQTNSSLVGNRQPLPERLTPDSLGDLARRLGVAASQRYWVLFQRVALALRVSRHNQRQSLAAARRQRLRRADRPASRPKSEGGEE